jgi:hypothetical protein
MILQRLRGLTTPLLIAALSTLLTACPKAPPKSDAAAALATSIKTEALALMDKATEPFPTHKDEVTKLLGRVDDAITDARSRPNNEASVKQWGIVKDPTANNLGGFLARWESDNTLSRTFIDETKGLVSDAFDSIVKHENGK